MHDRRGVEIEKIDPEGAEVTLKTGEIVMGDYCDTYLAGPHSASDCIDHYKPWL